MKNTLNTIKRLIQRNIEKHLRAASTKTRQTLKPNKIIKTIALSTLLFPVFFSTYYFYHTLLQNLPKTTGTLIVLATALTALIITLKKS